MKIRIYCETHKAPFVLLEGTVKFLDESGEYWNEASETATFVEIDEGNLYCSGGEGEHEARYELSDM